MIAIAAFVTLVSIAVPLYVYIGYPILLWILNKFVQGNSVVHGTDIPTVTLIVSCYNEEDVIREKLDNCLGLDYEKEKIEIVVISDGSEDQTDNIVKEYESKGVRLIRQEGRLGKTSGLNLGVAAARSEIIVFSDANAMYEKDSIKKLVRNFQDDRVGYVVGAALYIDQGQSSAAQSEDTYWQYEIFMKKLETRLHSVVGGDGAIYAIRKKLYDPLDREDINDFVNPLQIIAKGYRGVFESEAICYEETAGDFNKEAKRKERIVNRSFRGLMKVKSVMNPFKVGFFSLQIISHKLLRWLIPVFLIGIFVGSSILTLSGSVYASALLVLEMTFFWLACCGYLRSNNKSISPAFYYPYYFLLVNFYSLLGVLQALRGNIQITWSSPREKVNSTENTPLANTFFWVAAGISVLVFSIAVSNLI